MLCDEMIKLFLDSRKRGTTGARKKCSPRTIEVYERNLSIFFQWLLESKGINNYAALRRMHILDFLDFIDSKEKAGEWSRSTVLQMLRTLRVFFRWVDLDDDCKDQELHGMQRYLPTIEKNPMREFIPQLVDLRKLKNSFNTNTTCGFRDYVAVMLMLSNGIRIGELCSLKLDGCHWEEKTLIVDGKTGRRLVPLVAEMARLLKAWLKRRLLWQAAQGSDYVFTSKKLPQMNPKSWSKHLLRHRVQHNLPPITAHTLRHTFCTAYLKNGGDIAKLQNITGHKSIQMLMDYVHLAKLRGREAHDELERVTLLKEI